ncbi:LysM peptidoglycan-binding domain-containing protein [Salibacterium salarium]|uniref:LysM peptidoglycan-binding domain-containing protein n=1 Tax=Salibacterium salarium TaxID=284579 RepID=A0A428N235_9BACI|nr:glycoside hydrolase family 18 protein [Salibacterium salarium]RSL32369.1 LysM peptidoglycan-binding domain-containing protein [Salibacterium salarium]
MQIHVVNPGESLWSIGQMYNVPFQAISEANQLPNPDRLVVGQSLVIPFEGRYHWVMPGESVWGISQQYGIPFEHILRINNLPMSAFLPIGYPLYISSPSQMKPSIDVAAYMDLDITGENSQAILNEVGESLTFLTIFSYQMNADGTLTPIDDQAVINTALDNQIVPLMVITNIEDGQFSTELATTVLQSEELQNRLLDEALAIMEEKGFLGLDFDLEYVGAQNREAYNNLMRKAKERLDPRGYFLSSALAPQVEPGMEGDLYAGHDYAAQGEIADFLFLMTYEWGYTGSPPQAVAPIDQVRRVIEYAVSLVPNDKIMMGIPLYGYDWALPYVEGETQAEAIDHQQALELALQYNASIEYDTEAQSPHFTYYDDEGTEHEVWFDDARSIQAKFDLIKEFNLRGLFYWVLGWDFPQNWLLLEDNFNVNKRL